ncbi:FkbM family methyltransferase [Litorisediminicola beolgyonensis]|uniref:FkbM family methyltransferase n=1 Tax=Litorisediminicola beolgyonensis TaxID=1173614 RepID=A0ABW3ZNE5_9RHOB
MTDSTNSNQSFEALQALWERGDWDILRRTRLAEIVDLPERRDAALLVAAAHFHSADSYQTTLWLDQALDWGAKPQLVRQVLHAGLRNTCGRISASLGRDSEAESFFERSLPPLLVSGRRDRSGFLRRIAEMARMGLFPETVQVLGNGVKAERARDVPSDTLLTILESGLTQVSHELSLALQRNQIGTAHPRETEDPAAYAEAHSVSQLGQDIWVLEQSGFKRDGFFVEFGATNGILLSNTYLLENGFGWSGLCAEPNPTYFEQLRRNRRCTVSQSCISGETGREVEFILANEYGGFAEYADADMHKDKREAYAARGDTLTLTTVSLDDFLRQHDAPRRIDYLSIDTEGSEYEILSAFPFEDWDIRMLTVEHNFAPMREQIRALLEAQGYRCIEMQWDDWYIRDPAEKT